MWALIITVGAIYVIGFAVLTVAARRAPEAPPERSAWDLRSAEADREFLHEL